MTTEADTIERCAKYVCQRCDGQGWYIVPVCCGCGTFECCGNPDPGQEQCAECNGTGILPPPPAEERG